MVSLFWQSSSLYWLEKSTDILIALGKFSFSSEKENVFFSRQVSENM
jgi:hypothetical protein